MSGKNDDGKSVGGFFREMMQSLKRHPWRVVFALLLTALAGVGVYHLSQEWTREELVAEGRKIPGWIFIAAFMVLPLLGFPISIFLLLIGIRFGLGWGLLITTVGIFWHNVAAYWIAHGLFRDRVRDWFKRKGYEIPPVSKKHQGWFTALFAAVHGPPYFVKLYVLALTDIPLRTYVWFGATTYLLFAIPPLAFGHAFTDMGMGWLAVIVLIGVGTMVIGRWVKKRYDPAGDKDGAREGLDPDHPERADASVD